MLALSTSFALCFDYCLWDYKSLWKNHQRKLSSSSYFCPGFCFTHIYSSANWVLQRSRLSNLSMSYSNEFSFSLYWFLHYIFISVFINIQGILVAFLMNWQCLRALTARGTLWEVCMLMHYLLSANEKHIEINYDNLLHNRCGTLGICYSMPAKSSCGLVGLSARMPVWGGMISNVLSGIWNWHGRRQDSLQINYFISGAWSLCQHRNVLHSFPGCCWKCGIAVRFLLLLLKGFVCPDTQMWSAQESRCETISERLNNRST